MAQDVKREKDDEDEAGQKDNEGYLVSDKAWQREMNRAVIWIINTFCEWEAQFWYLFNMTRQSGYPSVISYHRLHCVWGQQAEKGHQNIILQDVSGIINWFQKKLPEKFTVWFKEKKKGSSLFMKSYIKVAKMLCFSCSLLHMFHWSCFHKLFIWPKWSEESINESLYAWDFFPPQDSLTQLYT